MRAWQRLLREACRDLDELLAALQLSRAQVEAVPDRHFPLLVPRGFIARMRPGDPADPLLRQVLPLASEQHPAPGFLDDPVGDLARSRSPGLIHKYPHRVLLIATGACAVHCRYCFRRHFPYADELAAREGWREALATIAADESIHEVILSGGDPLSLATARLAEFGVGLAGIGHLRRLRIHTRWPVVLPERVDAELLAWMRGLPWPLTVVLHANHAQELDEAVAAACARLRAAGATLLNQAVLLRGVNDEADALRALSERLGEIGVLPYYLHLLDRVQGAAHFEVGLRRARALLHALRSQLPGYLVPRLVRERPGATSKILLA
ncbi:MAG: putative L-lysine 2,3-aminomutase [Lysobacterales bacterium]|nr:L-lysine 2,3-aminomutase [Anaerolineae bacterium]